MNQESPFLVAAIVSLSSLYVSADEVESEYSFESAQMMSIAFSRLAKSHASDLYDKPSAYLVMAIRELVSWSHITASMYAGLAMRMARSLQLDRQTLQKFSARERELRIRVFWACFVVDSTISYSCNQTSHSAVILTSIPLPSLENVFLFGESHDGPTIQTMLRSPNKLSTSGVMPFFITMVQLWANMASLHICGGRRNSSLGPNDPNLEFYRCRKAIEDFASRLPLSLGWSVPNYQAHQVAGEAPAYVNFNFLLQHSRCVMHQEYLPQIDTQYALLPQWDLSTLYDAAGISLDHNDDTITTSCIAAVHAITDMAVSLHNGTERDRQLLQSVFAANAILTASAGHLWILYTQTCDKCPKDVALANAEKLREIIKSWQPQWRVASAWVETLEMLYRLYVYSYGKIVDSDLDSLNLEDSITTGQIVTECPTIEQMSHDCLLHNDKGTPQEPSIVYQRLQDNIRRILVNPLLATDAKKRHMRALSKSLWQYIWVPESVVGFGDDSLELELGNALIHEFPPSVHGQFYDIEIGTLQQRRIAHHAE